MPRKWPPYSNYFDPLFTEDVEELLARFQQTDTVRFEAFLAIWREMRFSDVYYGMHCMSEMKRFCRVTLATAVKYFLPPYSYQIRAGGLYLMYGLYYSQLAIPPVSIRIALKDWSHVEKFIQDSINSGHYDVVYIFKKLVAKKAIHYSAMPNFLHFRKQRTPNRETLCADFFGRSSVVQDLLSADILEEMSNIQNHYERMKAAMPEVHSKTSMTHRDLVTNLKDCMSEFIVWQNKTFPLNKRKDQDEEREEETVEEPSNRAKLLSSIKQKSFSNLQEGPKARRHRPVEVVSECRSGVENVQTLTSSTSRKKRPQSLFRRTKNKFGVTENKRSFNNWLLTIPEKIPDDRALDPLNHVS
ncbi:snRNA-activating protein complex subunit 1-like [Boleophthalmus pectinirostris]|uniref:snRNA-activating protein complex subunit 1-like n=1 Tax=Boleophthalmus pectinirostris TaxID=150288 RepID=UPI00242D6C34|nr:snRNA-activating protein complex subunit 1-like [Boleophthalmus pectinirostris]